MEELKTLMHYRGILKCKSCKKYLTVCPIYCITPISYICGRCVQITDNFDPNAETVERQWLFEVTATFFVFPCSYDIFGCEAELKIEEVIKHEQLCPFRDTMCPLNSMNKVFLSPEEVCNWRGDNKDLNTHIRSVHQKHFLKLNEFILGENKTSFYFAEQCSQVFLVIFEYFEEEQKFVVPVYANLNEEECNFYRYQLEISNESNFSVVFRKDRVDPLQDQISNNAFGIKIDSPYLKKLLNSNDFRIRVCITKKNKKLLKPMLNNPESESGMAQSSTESFSDREVAMKEKLLRQFECVICNDYMVPPIFLCTTGHSICNNCAKLVRSCPSCRCKMTSARNYQLEQIAESLEYPCRNKTIGCPFISSSENFKMHEMTCEYSEKPCIFQCNWKGDNIQMIAHLQEKHETLNPNDFMGLKMTSTKRKVLKAVIHNNHIFQLVLLWSSLSPLVFSVYSLSYNFKHKYQIHLIDKSENNLDIVVTYLCPILALNADGMYDFKNEYKLPFETIKHLRDENGEIWLQLTIFEVDS